MTKKPKQTDDNTQTDEMTLVLVTSRALHAYLANPALKTANAGAEALAEALKPFEEGKAHG